MASIRITDDVVAAMIANPAIKSEFDFINAPPTRKKRKGKKGCGGCGGNANKPRPIVTNTNAIKKRIAELPPNRLRRFKELLGVDHVRLNFKHREAGVKHKANVVI